MRYCVPAFLLLSGAVAMATPVLMSSPSLAEGMTREIARQKIVDSCVYSEWRDKTRRDTAAERCKCAAKRIVKAMDDGEFSAFTRAGKLTRVHREKWTAAMQACE